MSRNRIIYLAMAMIYLLMVASCSKKQAEEIKPTLPAAPDNPGAQVTYTNFVQTLFQARCSSCHAPGKQYAAIWSFNGYATVTTNAERIKQQVLVSKAMPIGGSLSAADLQSLKEWFDKGMAQ